MQIDRHPSIRELAAIGDGRSVAILDRAGSAVWMCLPYLDSPSAFASLLDPEKGGRFWLRPAIPFEVSRQYIPHTNVLETFFRTARGVVRVTDGINFGTVGVLSWTELARKVDGLSGRVPMEWGVLPRFEFGQVAARFEWRQQHPVTPFSEGILAVLAFDVGEVACASEAAHGRFELSEGDHGLVAVVASADAPLDLPPRSHIEARLHGSIERWRSWSTGMRYSGEWQEEVERSALALALTADSSTGAIIAASEFQRARRGQR